MNFEENAQLKLEAVYNNPDQFILWRPAKEKETRLEGGALYENASTISFSSDSSSSLLDDVSERHSLIQDTANNDDDYFERARFASSYSTPLKYPRAEVEETSHGDNYYMSVHERIQFLKEIEHIKESISQFKREMYMLEGQMNVMELDLIQSRNRVLKVEEGLTVTQEVSVNFQILLEKSMQKQRKTEKYAARAMQRIFSSLSTVAHETNRLKGKLIAIADDQTKRQGCAEIIAERIREYMHMLEQAHGTIHSLKQKRQTKQAASIPTKSDRKKSEDSRKHQKTCFKDKVVPPITAATTDVRHYHHRIIKKRASTPDMAGDLSGLQRDSHFIPSSRLPQRGLRILLTDYNL